MGSKILMELDGKWEAGKRPADLYAKQVSKRPSDHVAVLVEGLTSKAKRVRAGCAEMASLLSADFPELLYPHVELFLENMSAAAAPVLRWEAVCTLGNLAGVDERKVIAKRTDEMMELLREDSIVLQGHAVRALAKIALANPKRAAPILDSLFEAARHFPGTRVGYLIEATEVLLEDQALRPRIEALVSPYAACKHAVVARKANRVLRKLKPSRKRG